MNSSVKGQPTYLGKIMCSNEIAVSVGSSDPFQVFSSVVLFNLDNTVCTCYHVILLFTPFFLIVRIKYMNIIFTEHCAYDICVMWWRLIVLGIVSHAWDAKRAPHRTKEVLKCPVVFIAWPKHHKLLGPFDSSQESETLCSEDKPGLLVQTKIISVQC